MRLVKLYERAALNKQDYFINYKEVPTLSELEKGVAWIWQLSENLRFRKKNVKIVMTDKK